MTTTEQIPVESAHARIPISELAIREAAGLAADRDAHYLATMAAVLHYCPSISPDAYWELTVAEHTAICDVIGRVEAGGLWL